MKNRETMLNRQGSNQILGQDFTIPAATEDKIQAAYDIVRSKSRRKMEQDKVQPMKKRSFRRVWAAGIAAALVAVSGLGVLAATGYFSKIVHQDNGAVSYEFEINYELQPMDVQAKPTYLPEGMKEYEEDHYWTEEDYGHGISIWPLTMVNIDAQQDLMDFSYVEHVEKTTIQNMEAHIITYQEDQKYQRGKDIFLFNAEQGYVIWLNGDYNVPLEELQKVAEGLEITVTENADLKYDNTLESQKEQEKWEEGEAEWERLVNLGVSADQITPVGEALMSEVSGCSYTVNAVNVYDSLYDVPGYTEQGVYSMDALKPWIDENGNHKPYLRVHYDEAGKAEEEEEMTAKFLAVQVTVQQTEEPGDMTALGASLVRITQKEDGNYVRKPDFYLAVPSENYELQMDDSCFYLDQPENVTGNQRWSSFFWRTLEKGESLTYTLVFAVDADQIAGGEAADTVLWFHGTGMDETNPMYSALGEIK